jgi:hypothetical protein
VFIWEMMGRFSWQRNRCAFHQLQTKKNHHQQQQKLSPHFSVRFFRNYYKKLNTIHVPTFRHRKINMVSNVSIIMRFNSSGQYHILKVLLRKSSQHICFLKHGFYIMLQITMQEIAHKIQISMLSWIIWRDGTWTHTKQWHTFSRLPLSLSIYKEPWPWHHAYLPTMALFFLLFLILISQISTERDVFIKWNVEKERGSFFYRNQEYFYFLTCAMYVSKISR